ncbi:MAG: cell envelope biogenesis protein OmpA [Beijerinckiaceae bacterium]
MRKMMMSAVLVLGFGLTACGSSRFDRTLSGAAIGGAVGGVAGGIVTGTTLGVGVGAAAGAAVGGVVGSATTPRGRRDRYDD